MATGYYGKGFELMEQLGTEDMDSVRTVLAYLLMKSTDLDIENIYSLVFRDGSKITWH